MQLAGIRVVDLTRIISGPFCTQLLADLGAEVIKVETPEGDPLRAQGECVAGLSWYFAAYNRNKRSIVLDLRQEAGRAALAGLLADADVLAENFRPGVLAEMGFTEARLRAINPRLVTVSVNGFGRDGPMAERPAFDFIAQAMSGFMAVTGEPGGGPLRAGPPISDLVAGLYAALGVCAALLRRERAGNAETAGGEAVSVAMTDALMSFLSYFAADWLATGKPPLRSGNDHPLVAPYGLFATSDGEIAIAPSNDAVYRRLLQALDLEALRDHPDFATNALRMRHRASINALVGAKLALQPRAHWLAVLNAAGVPCGLVQGLGEALESPQAQHQQMVIEAEHPGHGVVRMLGFPIKFAAAPCQLRLPAPALGADTEAVLGAGLAPRAAIPP
jgi:crotonobetainyl-CoA:carnitine CoA-transferase CaiB-like acyl-CoA transferase